MQHSTVIAVAIAICVGMLLILVLSSQDDAVTCEAPETVSRFRGVGIGAGTIYTRALARRTDMDPLQTTPDPDSVSLTFAPPAPTGVEMPRISSFVWAWLMFVGNDVSYPRVASDTGTIYAGGTVPLLERDTYVLDSSGNRQQINYASPYIDLSQIYGNDLASYTAVRRNDGSGKLKTVISPDVAVGDDEMPVYNATTEIFIHLDSRYNQNLLLSALHVLFVREHNYWAETLIAEHPHLNENELFNIARHITIAEVQSITYNDFLPLLIGGGTDRFSGACFTDSSFRTDDDIAGVVDEYLHRTTVYNEWDAAALPVYQTLLPYLEEIRDDVNGSVIDIVSLTTPIATAAYIWENGIGGVLLGGALQEAELRDAAVEDSVRAFNGIDLLAVQVARGRERQLPPYQAYYDMVTGHRHASCERFAYNSDVCLDVDLVYGVDENVDLLTGIMIEKQSTKTILGPVGLDLFVRQFGLIRRNDYYFYLWDKVVAPYRFDIHHTTLSDIIARNTNVARVDLPKNVFQFS